MANALGTGEFEVTGFSRNFGKGDFQFLELKGEEKSFFYEAQETLRAADKPAKRKRREAIICNLLDRPEVNEILLYEAADWTYYLPLSDRLLSGHGYLDRQPK